MDVANEKFLDKATKNKATIFNVEKILNHRQIGKSRKNYQYFCKFEGFGEEHNDWADEMNAPTLVAQYWEEKKKERKVKMGLKRRGRKPKRVYGPRLENELLDTSEVQEEEEDMDDEELPEDNPKPQKPDNKVYTNGEIARSGEVELDESGKVNAQPETAQNVDPSASCNLQ